MADPLREGIDLFNRDRRFEAHEVWEDLWRATDTEARRFYQGLVQVAVGLHHLARGNRRGGTSVLRRGLANLEPYPDEYAGIDKLRLERDLGRLLAGAEADPAGIRVHLVSRGPAGIL
jgi:hypothetical protein